MSIEIQSKAFSAATVGNFSVKTSAESDVLGSATASLASVNIADEIVGKKIVAEMNVTVGFSDVNADLVIEGALSNPGASYSWATLATLSSDTTPNVTGPKVFVADLTSYADIPYVRFHFNTGGLSVGTSGKVQFKYAVRA
tara:strand:+ start:13816 stop:14238 length:423 start_codon:yes stop_codon:yes gene_type:complete